MNNPLQKNIPPKALGTQSITKGVTSEWESIGPGPLSPPVDGVYEDYNFADVVHGPGPQFLVHWPESLRRCFFSILLEITANRKILIVGVVQWPPMAIIERKNCRGQINMKSPLFSLFHASYEEMANGRQWGPDRWCLLTTPPLGYRLYFSGRWTWGGEVFFIGRRAGFIFLLHMYVQVALPSPAPFGIPRRRPSGQDAPPTRQGPPAASVTLTTGAFSRPTCAVRAANTTWPACRRGAACLTWSPSTTPWAVLNEIAPCSSCTWSKFLTNFKIDQCNTRWFCFHKWFEFGFDSQFIFYWCLLI